MSNYGLDQGHYTKQSGGNIGSDCKSHMLQCQRHTDSGVQSET